MTQVEALAKYAARASFDDLSAESRRQLPIHILDSLACCIAALGAAPIKACHEQVAEFGGTSPCTLIGGGQANPIYAAFWHTALVRYVDFMDNFLAQTETCHTADNFGVALTISPTTWAAAAAISCSRWHWATRCSPDLSIMPTS